MTRLVNAIKELQSLRQWPWPRAITLDYLSTSLILGDQVYIPKASYDRNSNQPRTPCSHATQAFFRQTTAIGKTVLAAWLIAQRGVNILVLVHRKQLLEQWVGRLSEFLDLPEGTLGRIGGGRKKPTGVSNWSRGVRKPDTLWACRRR